MKLSIYAKLPDYFDFFCSCGEDKLYLNNNIPVDVDVSEEAAVVLSQDENMSLKEKILTAVIALITVPFQVALFLIDLDWEDGVIPYRCQIKIKATTDTKCTLYVKRSEEGFRVPHISVIGEHITYEVIKVEPWVQAFDMALFRFLCKVIVLILLMTILMGALSVVSFTNGLHIAFIVVFATLLALLGCATYIVIYNIRKCATLKKQFLLICDS